MTPIVDLNGAKTLVIVKLSSIGDVVHALPFSAAVGRSFPHLRLVWAVESGNAALLRGNPYLHTIVEVPRAIRGWPVTSEGRSCYRKLRTSLRELNADVSVDLQGLTKSALVAKASGAPVRLGYDWLREGAPLMEKRVPRRPESVHIVDQFLDVARALGAEPVPVEFPLFTSPEDEETVSNLLCEAGLNDKRFLVVNPSPGKGGNKGWGAERFARAVHQMGADGIPIVLVGGPSDTELSAEIVRSVPTCTDFTGKTSVMQLVALIRRAAVHLCGDTGSAHIAAAMGTPVVTLFGRSNPARLAPYGFEKYVVHRRENCCEPCLRFHESAPVNAPQKCLQPPPVCMAAIPVDAVVEMVHRAWGEA